MFHPRLWAASVTLALVATSTAQNLTPEQAISRMRTPDGFSVRLVAAEPTIRQPLSMSFDDRGRMWVLQYLQYPDPAGLKAVSKDQYLRTVWDRVPEPPPHGPEGADRITILSDPDEHARYRQAKDFVGGLNLASGMALGHGGVWVAQPPYLLFYPDADGNDRPDGDPEVILAGFGMEDSHAYPNSLQWGPDGWLYGAQGSTVSASIRNPARPDDPPVEFEQGIWRYHPRTREFELFSEGGGNTWGLDFDRFGRIIAGTNFGGVAMLHQMQGAYHVKNFGKHGPLHNPHAYGYFGHVPYDGFKGGHVTNGGIVYQAEQFPERFHDRYVSGNLLANDLYWHELTEDRSTFKASFGGDFLASDDPWFRPVDCLQGPDGCVYVADWHDKRANHVDPIDTWDRTNGRIYRVEYSPKVAPFPTMDLARGSNRELIALLDQPNKWYRDAARRLFAERRDPATYAPLVERVRGSDGLPALESLWALYVGDGLTDALALEWLDHPNEHVRAWVVRLLGDRRRVTAGQSSAMAALAGRDPSPTVRSQLACTAKRLPASDGLPVAARLLAREEDADDPYIPLLLWWAIEDKAVSARSAVLALFESPAFWRSAMVGDVIVERIGRRYLAEGGSENLAACARLLALSPDAASTDRLIRGMNEALVGRRPGAVPAELDGLLTDLRAARPDDADLLTFAVRLGSPTALREALERAANPSVPEADRRRLVEAAGQTGRAETVPALLTLLAEPASAAMRGSVLVALENFDDPAVAPRVVEVYPKLAGSVRSRAQSLLAARPDSAALLLREVEAGRVPKDDIPLSLAQRMSRFDVPEVRGPLGRLWGQLRPETDGEKLARARALNVALSRGVGDPGRGKELFTKHCASCHKLFGEGNEIGPDLTTADRNNRLTLLTHIIDPSAYIRPEYTAFEIETFDGRLLTGLLRDQTPAAVTLVDAKNQETVVSREDIEELRASPISLMPEKLLAEFTDEMAIDLFAYLQKDLRK